MSSNAFGLAPILSNIADTPFYHPREWLRKYLPDSRSNSDPALSPTRRCRRTPSAWRPYCQTSPTRRSIIHASGYGNTSRIVARIRIQHYLQPVDVVERLRLGAHNVKDCRHAVLVLVIKNHFWFW